MRVWQFEKFIWQFDIVPYWEAKLSDVNYMALAQHYGFETLLLDITSYWILRTTLGLRYFLRPVNMSGRQIPTVR